MKARAAIDNIKQAAQGIVDLIHNHVEPLLAHVQVCPMCGSAEFPSGELDSVTAMLCETGQRHLGKCISAAQIIDEQMEAIGK